MNYFFDFKIQSVKKCRIFKILKSQKNPTGIQLSLMNFPLFIGFHFEESLQLES